MRIEDGYAVFDINIVGVHTNNSYYGTFKVKCLLSPIEQIKADKLYRDLLGNNAHLASNHVGQLAYAASQLHLRVTEAPPFWESNDLGGSHIEDENVILSVLDSAIEAQVKFVEEKKEELIKRQEILANRIRKKVIVAEEEEDTEQVKSYDERQAEKEAEDRMDSEDGTKLEIPDE